MQWASGAPMTHTARGRRDDEGRREAHRRFFGVGMRSRLGGFQAATECAALPGPPPRALRVIWALAPWGGGEGGFPEMTSGVFPSRPHAHGKIEWKLSKIRFASPSARRDHRARRSLAPHTGILRLANTGKSPAQREARPRERASLDDAGDARAHARPQSATPFTLLRALLGAACNRPEPWRHSMEPPSSQQQTTITPVALDMRLPDESLRETGRAAMRDTLTPMLAVHHHGCSEQLAELATRARAPLAR